MASETSEHCGDVALALVATGHNSPSAVFDRHAVTCPQCRRTLASFTEVVDTAGASLVERAYSQPPAGVWRSIAADAGAAGSDAAAVVELPVRPVDDVEQASARSLRWPLVVAALVAVIGVLLVLLGVALN